MDGRKGKREKPDFSASLPKRRRRLPPAGVDEGAADDLDPAAKRSPASVVVVTRLPTECTVLELKSRMELYGPISRIRMDPDGSGYVAFRSDSSAEAAVGAARDSHFGIVVASQRVEVFRGSDPLPQWRKGIEVSSLSRHQAEMPLSKHGKCHNKLSTVASSKSESDIPNKGRELVAYDDLF